MVTFSKFVDVDKTERLNYVIGGSFNNSVRGFKSPGGWYREQTGGEAWDKTGQVDPAPEGIITSRLLEHVRMLVSAESSDSSDTTTFASLFVVDGTEN
jgi:hypothetical protein